MNSKRKLLISMLAIVFVLLAVVATVAIAFALTQQTITTTLNIGYVVEDIDGTASATYTIGGVTESLTAKKGNQVIGDTLVFHAGDTEDAGNLMFPEGQIPLSAQNDNIVIQYTYSNTGAKHYIASMSFDSELVADNMKVEYSIDGTTYSENRYAVVVPANTANRSYWIKISIDNKAKSASFTGDFNWLLSGCDEQSDSYLSLSSLEFTGSNGSYSASVAKSGSYTAPLVFPSEVNGDPVTTIVASSLTDAQKQQVTSVYIPDSVTTIGDNAFENFTNLQTVTLEQNETAGASAAASTGLTTIGQNAFKNCSKLDNLVIPNTVTSFNSTALTGCSSLKNITADTSSVFSAIKSLANTYTGINLIIGNSVTSINVFSFSYCTGLTSVTIGSGVTSIGSSAFSGCTGLTSVTIGSGVTSIDSTAFVGCTGLNRIIVEEGNTKYSSAGNCLIETASKTLLWGCKTSVIPTDGSVTSIGNSAFSGCIGLTEIEITDSVTSIGDYAFRDCTGLTEIEIPDSVTIINRFSFYGCTGLTSIEIPNSVTSIGDSAFSGCTGLTSVTIGSGVTSICLSAFFGCTGLTEIEIPGSVTSIDGSAFYGCTGLTSVTIGNDVTSIGSAAFQRCTGLTSVTFANKTGWKAGSTTITESQLSDPATAATLLRDTYCNNSWTRS